MRPDVADIAEHKADEHEEKADQRERSGRADHLCKQADKKSPSVLLCFFTLKLRVKLLAFFLSSLRVVFPSRSEVDRFSTWFQKWGWKFLLCKWDCAHKACVFSGA